MEHPETPGTAVDTPPGAADAISAQLQVAHQRLAYHVDNSPVPIIEWDSDFRLARWSRRAEELFGWRQDELLGRHPADWNFVHDEDVESVGGVIHRLLSGAEPRNVSRNRNYTRDGRILHTEWYNSVLLKPDGHLDSILSMVLDVTARVEAEETRRKLVQSQKLESVGQLTAGLAHDFNNLLTVILGSLQLIERQSGGNPAVQRRLRSATDAALRGNDLIRRLLAFSRRQVLTPVVVRIETLLPECVELFKRALGEEIEVRTRIEAQLWPVEIDAHELETALLNLAINARDAMPGGGILNVEARNHIIAPEYARRIADLRPGEYVLLTVSDTGHGMPESVRARVFEPFFTTKPEGRGTGLGLSMVYGFMKQSGGHIEIYTEEGQGTSINLYLPRAHDAGGGDWCPDATPATDAPTGTETVLVVEDNAELREIAQQFLADAGYKVLTAADGMSALAMIRKHPDIALLFTDVVMPGQLRGDALADEALRLRPGLAVLYTSGHPKDALRTDRILQPDFRMLRKPYQSAELAGMVRMALDERNT